MQIFGIARTVLAVVLITAVICGVGNELVQWWRGRKLQSKSSKAHQSRAQ